MSKVVVFKNADNSVSVLIPSPQCHLSLEEIIAKDGQSLEHQIIDAQDLPDKCYRDAWILIDGKVEHDLAKARELHKNKLRALRAPLLLKLDVDYQKADEDDNKAQKNKVAQKKKALRDITAHSSILEAASVEQLKEAAILELDNIMNS